MTTPQNHRSSPLHGHLDPASFHPSPSHEEALARLHYLVEQHLRIGVVLGEAGSGKSLLLAKLASDLRTSGRKVVHFSLLGMEVGEALREVAVQLQLSPVTTETTASLWRAVSDRLKEHKYLKQDTVVLLDDADEADPETLNAVCRLSELDASEAARLTLVVASQSHALTRLPARLLQRAALRIDVEPWEQQDTLEFLTHAVEQLRAMDESEMADDEVVPEAVFSEDAVARLHALSGGLPRRVGQLAQWSLLAGAGMGLTQVDEDTVVSAAEELGLQSASPESIG